MNSKKEQHPRDFTSFRMNNLVSFSYAEAVYFNIVAIYFKYNVQRTHSIINKGHFYPQVDKCLWNIASFMIVYIK